MISGLNGKRDKRGVNLLTELGNFRELKSLVLVTGEAYEYQGDWDDQAPKTDPCASPDRLLFLFWLHAILKSYHIKKKRKIGKLLFRLENTITLARDWTFYNLLFFL